MKIYPSRAFVTMCSGVITQAMQSVEEYACITKRNCLSNKGLICKILSKCVVAEITSNRKNIFFVVLYRSPSQSLQQFNQFLDDVESMISNIKKLKPHCLVITGDFNCRSSTCWSEDNENSEGIELDDLLDSLNMSQVINQPTHVRQNTHSCIDLIITDQPNLIVDSGVHPSLHQNCQHDIIYGVDNLQIPSPPTFKRSVWKYHEANVELLKSDLNSVNWDGELRYLDSTEATAWFTNKLLSIVSAHIPNAEILCGAKDTPWITKRVKDAIRRKHRIYKKTSKMVETLENGEM